MALGMIGTVTGFILMLGSSFESIDVLNTDSLKDTLTAMAIGMSTALYTTASGLISSLWLKTTLVVVRPVIKWLKKLNVLDRYRNSIGMTDMLFNMLLGSYFCLLLLFYF